MFQQVTRYIKIFRAQGIELDENMFNVAINAFGKSGHYEDAVKYFQMMTQRYLQ
jgi:pentatricopeptide repeat protein